MKTYSINKWRELFRINRKLFSDGLSFIDSTFVGFNANLDFIAVLDSKQFDFSDVSENCRLPVCIRRMMDLKRALVYSFKRGKAVELKITNMLLYNSLLKRLKFVDRRMGGQMGIVANLLSRLGVKKTIVFSNSMSHHLSSFFNDRIYFPVIKARKVVLKDVRNVGFSSDEPRINIIIEFKKGTKVKAKNSLLVCPRSNRLIISSPTPHALPLLPNQLLRKELFGSMRRIFLAGYHHVNRDNHKKVFKEWKRQMRVIKAMSHALLHLEYVDLHKDWLNKEIFELLNYVDSFGLNEVEMSNIMKYLGYENLHSSIVKEDFSASLLVKAGKIIMRKFGLKRLSIHTLFNLIVIVEKDYPVKDEDIAQASIFAVRTASAKAVYGKEFCRHIDDKNLCPISPKGLKSASFDSSDEFRTIIVPNLKCKARFTVGLGDTISSVSFYAEDFSSKRTIRR